MSIQHDNIKIILKNETQKIEIKNKIETYKCTIPSNPYVKNRKIPYNINVNVESISDLISITEKYKFDSKYYYNINLKALHNIKDDLILLNNMIGLNSFTPLHI